MRPNTPFGNLEVKNQPQTSCKLSKRSTGLYWEVEAEGTERGQGARPRNYGTSEATNIVFKKSDEDAAIKGRNDTTDFAPPKNMLPVDQKVFTEKEAGMPILLRWTPVLPRPKENLIYKVKIVQILPGQSKGDALRNNKPLDMMEVKNDNQVPYKLAQRCNGCIWTWNVEAVGTQRIQGGTPRNYGSSEPTSFMMSSAGCGTNNDNVTVACKGWTNGRPTYTVSISFSNIIPNSGGQQCTTMMNTISSTTGTITGIATLPVTIPAGGSSPVVTFTYTPSVSGATTASFSYQGIWNDGNSNTSNFSNTNVALPSCICDPCKTLGVSIRNDRLTNSGSQILLSGMLSGLDPNVVKKITIEMVYYDIEQTGDENCVKCAENKEWGNFIKPARYYFANYGQGILNGLSFGREWTWLSKVQKECGNNSNGGVGYSGPLNEKCTTCGTNTQISSSEQNNTFSQAGLSNPITPIIIQPPYPRYNTFSLPIAVPPGSSLKCCSDKIKVCIRYTIWDFCCKACDIIKCYEIDRKAQ